MMSTDQVPDRRIRTPTAESSTDLDGQAMGATSKLTAAERVARGRAARKALPRASHATFEPSQQWPDRISLLEGQAKTRVPELVPIRYGRMLVSPFTFFRGAALIMAADLAATPGSGIGAQICGDAHLSNFGAYASPERRLVFDINDFDETLPGPWEWDVKRLAASLALAGRDNGYSISERKTIVQAAASQYRTAMRRFAEMHNLEVWYAHLDVETLLPSLRKKLDPDRFKLLKENVARARTHDSLHAFSKLTETASGGLRIISDPPLIVPLRELMQDEDIQPVERELLRMFRGYSTSLESDRQHLFEQFRFVEHARKVVGVGSVGTRAWISLFLGRDGGDPLFLQEKEAEPSVLAHFLDASKYRNHGQRVVSGQRLMQGASDIFLGWHRVTGMDRKRRDFYVRQLRDWKWSIDPAVMRPGGMVLWSRLCAWTLARAHARSGDRIAIAAYLGRSDVFDRAMVVFAEAYADQTERDHRLFAEAINSGRIKAQTGL
jgi:uncharacterized protein (DUF2252 family)